ncbi:hypothetical protein TNCV_2715141 [Trichonephila clavipes]|nr:hypothetical protein TNCV_2715141 [Trichonephila clavipes]
MYSHYHHLGIVVKAWRRHSGAIQSSSDTSSWVRLHSSHPIVVPFTAAHAYVDKEDVERVMISDSRAHGSTREGRMAQRQYQLDLLEGPT